MSTEAKQVAEEGRLPSVAVMMATYNGEAFVGEQLRSIAAQKAVDPDLWISDDGSTDGTLTQISSFASAHPLLPVRVLQGPRRGFVSNFLSLACRADLRADHYAFSDQDDVWHPDKLSAAIAKLAQAPVDRPALYMSRTRTLRPDGSTTGFSPAFLRTPSLENALVQSIGGGNTMVFNEPMRRLLIAAGPDVAVPSHDWWAYLVATACGGHVIYDPDPYIDYRQHEANIVGENSSFAARILRIRMLMRGQFRDWLDANLDALKRVEPRMTDESRRTVAAFRALRRSSSAWRRVAGVRRLKLYRQTTFGQMSLNLAILLRKL